MYIMVLYMYIVVYLWPIAVVLNVQTHFSVSTYLLYCCKVLCKALQSLSFREDSPEVVKS